MQVFTAKGRTGAGAEQPELQADSLGVQAARSAPVETQEALIEKIRERERAEGQFFQQLSREDLHVVSAKQEVGNVIGNCALAEA